MRTHAPLAAVFTAVAALAAGASGLQEDALADPRGLDRIEINSGALPVLVTGGSSAEVVLDSDLSTEFPWDDAPTSQLRMEREGTRLYAWVEGEAAPGAIAKIIVRLPRGASLSVNARSGAVTVEGMDGGTCHVRTVSGRIVLRRDRCRVTADSVSGDIEIDSSRMSLQAHTVSGSIDARRLALSSDAEFSSISGSIDVGLDSDVESYTFDLRSLSGPISVAGIRTQRGLRMGFGPTRVHGHTVSGALSFTGPDAGPGTNRPARPAPSAASRSGRVALR